MVNEKKRNVKSYVFDIEGDSLNPSKIHCLSVHSLTTGVSKTTTNYDEMRKFFEVADVIVGHNIARWDIPNLERLLGIKIECEFIDTLFLSWYLEPNRPTHGLEDWGVDLGIPKPKIHDWANQTIEEYIHRCEEDVKINTLLWEKQWEELKKIYGSAKQAMRLIRYLMFKAQCAVEQEKVKWPLDITTCKSNLEWFQNELELKQVALINAMPKSPKYGKKVKPKVMFTKDGSLSALGKKWNDFLAEQNLPFDTEGEVRFISGYEEPNPNSTSQVKDWLDTLNWVPETFKYVRDKETGDNREIPQINLPQGAGICPSIKKLYDKEPALENLDSYFVIKHRIGLLEGFLRDVDENGYLQAQVQGLTNTLRFKHKTIVNLPKATMTHDPENGKIDYRDGSLIRGCLIAPPGKVLCGSDMSSLEDRTKQHYMWDHDPDYVSEMLSPDFDPHLDLAVKAGALTEEQAQAHKEGRESYKAIRHIYKTTNYAATYGAGASTIARAADISVKEGKKLHEAYWLRNWSIKTIADLCEVKKVNGKPWLFNPVSGLWYSLRSDKDRFSTLNQGTGVFCFDAWVKMARNKGITVCGQFHDEIIAQVDPEDKEKVKTILKQSVAEVNEALQLNRDLDVEVQFGDNYAEIH